MLILGAGADRIYGIPTITELLAQLAAFVAEEGGTDLDHALRKRLPYLRFSFDKYAAGKSDEFVDRLFTSAEDVVPTIRSAATKMRADSDYAPLGSLLDQLCNMAENNQLRRSDLASLASFAGIPGDVGDTEPILDPRTMTLSPVPSGALRGVFQRALADLDRFDDKEREVFSLFIEATSNIEELLSHCFTLSAVGKSSDRRTYLYLVWVLWAYLRYKSSGRVTVDESIYAKIPAIGADVVTFNYTNFFLATEPNRTHYFHGRLDRYLRLDDRETVLDDRLRRITSLNDLTHYIEERRLDVEKWPAVDVPHIIPPTAFKPVWSREQLRTWVDVDDVLQRAALVVVVGYSFAIADEHFNDLLRKSNEHSRVLVVNPDETRCLPAACHALGITSEHLTQSTRSGFSISSSGRLVFVAAKSEDVNSGFIAEMTR